MFYNIRINNTKNRIKMNNENFLKRVEKISNTEACQLLQITPYADMLGETRDLLNKELAMLFDNEELDEIDLIVIEIGT